MKLRDYQSKAVRTISKHWRDGAKNVLAVAPTGSGKGAIAAHMMVKASRDGERVLFVVHLRDIAEDMAQRVRALGARCGVVMPGHELDLDARIQIASVQSMAGRKMGRFDQLVVDEAHHYRADEWQGVLEAARAKRMLGLTATPQRADGKGLGEVFDVLVDVVSPTALLKAGHIVKCRSFVPQRPLDSGTSAMDPAEAYLKYGQDRHAFIFARNLESAAQVVKALGKAGVSAALVCDKTPYAERSASIAALRVGKLRAIVNYGTMTEGVDVPRVSCVVLDQPCLHEGSYLQRAGRALRPFKGKRDSILIDLTDATRLHGLPIQDREYSLTGDEPIKLAHGLVPVRRAPRERADIELCDVDLVEASQEWLSLNGGPRFLATAEMVKQAAGGMVRRKYDGMRNALSAKHGRMFPYSGDFTKYYGMTFAELVRGRRYGDVASIEEVREFARGRTKDEYNAACALESNRRGKTFPHSNMFAKYYGMTFTELARGRRWGDVASIEDVLELARGMTTREYNAACALESNRRGKTYPQSHVFPKYYGMTFAELRDGYAA